MGWRWRRPARSVSPIASVRRRIPSSRRAASPPTVTISRGRSSRSSCSRQNAQSSCSRGRRQSIATARRRAARVAPSDGRAVERRVEPLLVHLQPGAQRAARAAAPGSQLGALDQSGRLSVEVGLCLRGALEDGQRLERIARLRARAAAPVVALERREGAVRHALLQYVRGPSARRRPELLRGPFSGDDRGAAESARRSRRRARCARRS